MPFEAGHALLIGVGSHKYAPHLDVAISVMDAQAVADVLTSDSYCGYPAHQVKVLHDASASREGILGALSELAGKVEPDDTVTIFYCGHGDYGTDGEYYLVSHDARISGNKVQAGTGVSQAALVDNLQKIPAKRVLVVFNACHSGEISPTLSVEQALGSKILPDIAKDALLSSGLGRIIITACREEQLSYIGKGELSVFTQALVDGLRGKGIVPRGGFISAFDLYTATFESVNEHVKAAYDKVQEPELTVLQGVGPFAVALYKGSEETNLGLAEEVEEPPEEAAARVISAKKSQQMFQQIIQTGGVSFGQGNVIDIGGDVIGEQQIDTGGGAFIRGNVNTGGGAFTGRDQSISKATTFTQGASLEQFTDLLIELRRGLESAGFETKIQGVIERDLSDVENEAADANPNLVVIESKLNSIRNLLQKAAGTGAAVIGLIEIVQRGAEIAQQLFK
jgi:uncharacterized caspase-like protein